MVSMMNKRYLLLPLLMLCFSHTASGEGFWSELRDGVRETKGEIKEGGREAGKAIGHTAKSGGKAVGELATGAGREIKALGRDLRDGTPDANTGADD